MNHYTTLLIYLKGLFEKDKLVNVVKQGEQSESDLDKMTVFPMVNIEITPGNFTNGSTVVFGLTIIAVDQRDVNKKINEDTFWGNTNKVDILNETHAILNRAWTTLYRDFEKAGIKATENAPITPIIHEGKSILDGWQVDFDVEMPNQELSLCQYN